MVEPGVYGAASERGVYGEYGMVAVGDDGGEYPTVEPEYGAGESTVGGRVVGVYGEYGSVDVRE